ncbi:MAG TPA: DUF5063 domain-containing protein [Segeticoccus sp.]|uniref:DUF5063 domain-containing protein n=1 Tax=Segeticoccus sp. TaxID=2706531 RepID=UPI002D7FDBB8|nr:DUF5063 domain-containing protein [Segeticoccus sp.]HET8598778.1 DUF5063 domain-containing protein [Segeticoccus sp.]
MSDTWDPTVTPDGATGDGTTHETGASADLRLLAEETAREARTFVSTVREVASGSAPESAIPLLLLALSQVLVTGARLGAITDIVPAERYEPDSGPDPDLDPVRQGLANLFEGIDDYADLVDPVTSLEVTRGSVSNDVSMICEGLGHGLRHYDAGQVTEALWWWQFSYLSSWGERAASALRLLQGVLSHLRLDADEETVADAEFDALHP